MTEYYSDILHNGQVVGQQLVSDTVTTPEPERTTSPLMTHVAFLNRFTDTEQERLDGALQASWQVRAGFRKFQAAREVDVTDADMRTQIAAFGASGILDSTERVPVLLAEIPLTERGAIHPETRAVTQ